MRSSYHRKIADKEAINMIIKDAASELNSKGYTLISSIIPVDDLILPLWLEMYGVAGLIANQLGYQLADFSSPELAAQEFLRIGEADRSFIARLYDQCKQLPSFLRLVSWQGFADLYSSLTGSSLVGIGENSYGIRFDLPNEDRFRSDWHQEYSTNPQSPDGIVFWIPLVDMHEGMGSVEILRSSNREGFIHHVEIEKYAHKTGLYRLGIPNDDALTRKYCIDQPLSNLGDLLLMRFDTIHQSGNNISTKLRVTLQVRYFNFNNPVAMARGWPAKPSQVYGYNVDGKK
jgi:hypothetical protein